MKSDILLVGFGPGTVSFINSLSKKKINNNLKVIILEKNKKNFFGGIAYSQNGCEYGFFNNPIRLSPESFQIWLKKKKNRIECYNFLKNINNYSVKDWLIKNSEIFLEYKNIEIFEELYLPRVIYSFYLRKTFQVNRNINLFIIHGNFYSFFKSQDSFEIKIKTKSIYKFNYNQFNKIDKKYTIINSKYLIANTSIVNPKEFGIIKSKNYISSYYEQGATAKLIKLINRNKSGQIKIGFLGSKAGFLEPLIEIKHLINDKNINIKIIGFSNSGKTLEPAIRKKFNQIKLNNLNKLKKRKAIKAKDIFISVLKEFSTDKKINNKYEIWTQILKEDILKDLYMKLSNQEKVNYSKVYFSKLRKLTRFTYPETVNSFFYLKKKELIDIQKCKILEIIDTSKKIKIKLEKNSKIYSENVDILVNVTGILKPKEKNLSEKKIFNLFDLIGTYTKHHEHIIFKNLYVPSTFAINFNPSRYTILKAVTNNNSVVAKKIYSKLKYHSK